MKFDFKKIVLLMIIACVFLAMIIMGGRRNHTHTQLETTSNEEETATTIASDEHTKSTEATELETIETTETTETTETEITETTEEEDNGANNEDHITISTTPSSDDVTNEKDDDEESGGLVLVELGRFKLTAYCSCVKCCGKYALNRPVDEYGNEIVYGSIGARLYAGVSIAVDPSVIPYWSNVIINGHAYTAHDTGGGITGNRIDIYFDDHQDALNFGVQYADVFLVID